jgi:hypothetical protein
MLLPWPNLLVLPSGGTASLCTVEGDRIIEVALLGCPPPAAWAVSDAGWVACLHRGARAVSRIRVDGADNVAPHPDLSLPAGHEAACLAFHGDVLYVGGSLARDPAEARDREALLGAAREPRETGPETVGLFDLALEQPAWQPLELPEQLRKAGKAIDALVVDRSRLVAVDNLIFPVWLLSYDAADPRSPRLVESLQLPSHGTYEHVASATLGTGWLAVFSTTIGMFGQGRHVCLLDRGSLRPYGGVSWLSRSWTPQGTVQNAEPPWEGIAFQGDVLYVACGEGGLGVLDLTGIEKPETPPAMNDRGRLEGGGFSARCGERLRRVPTGEAGEVAQIVPVPGGDRPVLVLREGTECRCVLAPRCR